MKNAMKKIMSLVLVAMILVSAIPFGASADGFDPISVEIYQLQADGSDFKAEASYPASAERVPLSDILATYGITAKDINGNGGNGKEAGAWANGYQKYVGDTVPAGCVLKIRKVAITPAPVETQPAPTETQPAPTETQPAPTETQPAPTETQPAPTETQPAPVVESIKIVVKNGSSSNVIWSGEKVPANNEYAYVQNLLSYCFNGDWSNVYKFEHAWSTDKQSNVELGDKIYAGDTLSVMLSEKQQVSTTPPTTPPTTTPSTNNGNSYNANTGNVTNNSTSYSKFAYPVYLNIYTDTTVGTVKKTINITNGIAADGRVTLSEVKNLVPNYYTAEVAATGIIYDGLYPAQGNWVLDYVVDQKYDIIEGLYEAASNNYVYINVMLTNAKALSTSTSTSTNPKTGDEIYMAVTGLALSACALATVFYFTKKRAI